MLILQFFYFLIMRLFAPSRYGPYDVPPVTYKGKPYKRVKNQLVWKRKGNLCLLLVHPYTRLDAVGKVKGETLYPGIIIFPTRRT